MAPGHLAVEGGEGGGSRDIAEQGGQELASGWHQDRRGQGNGSGLPGEPWADMSS